MAKPTIANRPARSDERIWSVIAVRGSYQNLLTTPRGGYLMTIPEAQDVINADARENSDNDYMIMRAHTAIERTTVTRVRKV